MTTQTSTRQPCRLLVDGPAPGDWQMAVDEALLESAATTGACTLRFYGWSEPTLSLGYFQDHAERASHPASRACPMVRRQTGGGAILHDRELTYSLTMPVASSLGGDVQWLYAAVHDALLSVLTTLGVPAQQCVSLRQESATVQPFLCFQRRSQGDVLSGDFKICGSAQRRRRGAILQHGSVLLAASTAAPELPGIAELTGKDLSGPALVEDWARELAEGLRLALSEGELEPGERRAAESLIQQKYGCRAWTERR